METELKALYAAWLAKHNAPDAHPHRELFDMLVGSITAAESRLDKIEAMLSGMHSDFREGAERIRSLT